MASGATSESSDEPNAVEQLRAVREILRGHVPPPTIEEDAVVARVRAAVSGEITAYHREILEGLSELRGTVRRLEERVNELEDESGALRELIHLLIDRKAERKSRG